MISCTDWYAEGSYINLLDHRVFYRRGGSGVPMVCIHGFPSSSWDYEVLWSRLTEEWDIIASDLIGLGRSSKNGKITVHLQADIIEELMISLGISAAHILAHDLGDTVAQELLARQLDGTNRVQWLSCILMNGGIFPDAHRPRLIQKLLLSPFGSLIAKFTSENTLRKTMHDIFSKEHPPSEAFIKDTWQLMESDNGRAAIPKLIKYMKERVTYRERWVAPLVEKTVPMRLINGVDDPISGSLMADYYEEIVPDPDIVRIQQSGHYPHLETPDAVWDAISGFHHL